MYLWYAHTHTHTVLGLVRTPFNAIFFSILFVALLFEQRKAKSNERNIKYTSTLISMVHLCIRDARAQRMAANARYLRIIPNSPMLPYVTLTTEKKTNVLCSAAPFKRHLKRKRFILSLFLLLLLIFKWPNVCLLVCWCMCARCDAFASYCIRLILSRW